VLPNVETKGSSMKYEVKGLTSYGVYDGDRLLGSYESEKSATLVCDALNEEAGRATEAAHKVLAPSRWLPGRGIHDCGYAPSNSHDKETI
jgi:hypothetical protein